MLLLHVPQALFIAEITEEPIRNKLDSCNYMNNYIILEIKIIIINCENINITNDNNTYINSCDSQCLMLGITQ